MSAGRWLRGCDRALVSAYDVALLDLDGVVYVGGRAVEHAPDALAAARRAGMRCAFVTNNASRTPAAVAAHLNDLGVEAADGDVVTSAQAAAHLLADRLPPGAAVLVVGGEGLEVALRERGLVPVSSLADEPQAVAQGFSPDVDWRMLAEGALAVAQGLPWVASNTDLTVPTPRGQAPGNGALVGVIAQTTGRTPEVAGKPRPPLHRETVERTGAHHPLVVGDRLETDIEGANATGADSLLVLTGVTGPARLLTAQPQHRPTYVARDLRGLLRPAPGVETVDGGFRCGRWTARGGAVVASDDGSADADGLEALRAACALSWARMDRGDAPLDAGVLDGAGVGAIG